MGGASYDSWHVGGPFVRQLGIVGPDTIAGMPAGPTPNHFKAAKSWKNTDLLRSLAHLYLKSHKITIPSLGFPVILFSFLSTAFRASLFTEILKFMSVDVWEF